MGLLSPSPGRGATGLCNVSPELAGKRLELLKEVVPKLARGRARCATSPRLAGDGSRGFGPGSTSADSEGRESRPVRRGVQTRGEGASRRIDCAAIPTHEYLPEVARHLGGAHPAADGVCTAGVRGDRRAHGLWPEHSRAAPPC